MQAPAPDSYAMARLAHRVPANAHGCPLVVDARRPPTPVSRVDAPFTDQPPPEPFPALLAEAGVNLNVCALTNPT